MNEILRIAEQRINELLKARGYIFEYEMDDIVRDVLLEDSEKFYEALRNGNVTFIDWSN